jgi:hypothetical protein
MTEIRSYRRVFDLERRIYRIDRLRLNPGGIPVRGVVYFLAIIAAALVAARVPGLATVAGSVPWYLRDLALPGASAAVLAVIRVEGRPFHLAAQALLRHYGRGRTLSHLHPGRHSSPGTRWRPEQMLTLPDGSDACMRRLRYIGPGALLIAVAHRREVRTGIVSRRPRLDLRSVEGTPPPARAEVIVLERAARLIVR